MPPWMMSRGGMGPQMRVVETSEDPRVQMLVRRHARGAVSEFVEGGMERAMRGTPLPEGYRAGP